MRKILIATMALDIGGAETHIVELAKELKARGYDVLITSNGGVYEKELAEAGVRLVKVPLDRRRISAMLKSYVMLRRIIKTEKPDVVHAHARIPGFIIGLIRRTVRFPFVTTAHWVFDTSGLQGKLTNWGEKTIAVSDDISDYLTDNYGIEKKDIIVTINGIDVKKFSPSVSGAKVRTEFGIPDDAIVVAHVSRLDESRELAAKMLVSVAEKLGREEPKLVILIAGDGNARADIELEADRANRALGRKCVIMAGARTDINEIVAAGDIFVGVSRAALEAMAAGKPTVLAGNEGYLGLFTEEKLDVAVGSNFCCRGCEAVTGQKLYDDITAFVRADSQTVRSVSEFSRNVVLDRYSVSRMADDAEKAYSAVLKKRNILLSGYYGYGNAGDEAILQAVYNNIQDADPDVSITVLSGVPEKTFEKYGYKAVDRFHIARVRKAIKDCDALVFGGGSVIQDQTSTRSLIYYLTLIRLAKRKGKAVMVYANGIGPVTKKLNRTRTRLALEKADVITLRDPDSLKELESIGVSRNDIVVTADPVFTMPEPDKNASNNILKSAGIGENDRFVIVAVRDYRISGNFRSELATLCDKIVGKLGYKVLFVPMQGKDREISTEVSSMMREPSGVLDVGYLTSELMGVFAASSGVIAMRLHALIFAARTLVPAAGIVYDPKVSAYLDMLGLPSIGSADSFTSDKAMDVFSGLMDNREKYSDDLRRIASELDERARKDPELLMKLLRLDAQSHF